MWANKFSFDQISILKYERIMVNISYEHLVYESVDFLWYFVQFTLFENMMRLLLLLICILKLVNGQIYKSIKIENINIFTQLNRLWWIKWNTNIYLIINNRTVTFFIFGFLWYV